MDQWGKLWELAIGDEVSGPAKIIVNKDCGSVTLEWPDGSVSGLLYWNNGGWQFAEALNTCLGSVVAWDSF